MHLQPKDEIDFSSQLNGNGENAARSVAKLETPNGDDGKDVPLRHCDEV